MRGDVLWLGSDPPAELQNAATARRLLIKARANTGTAQFAEALSNARALILSVEGSEDTLIEKARLRLIASARQHGVPTWIVTPLGQLTAVQQAFKDDDHWRRPRLVTLDNVPSLLDQIVDTEPGPSWRRDVKFSGLGYSKLGDEDQLLLQRAFHDCTEVCLEPLVGGSATVFQAFARLRTSLAGPCPLPFFVKIDRYPKIQREIENYRSCTALFVPFYARPNLDFDRCMLGDERGIIVGNFVEHSNSLAELITQGSAQTAINSLFDDALRGWRQQAILPTSSLVERPLANSMGGAARTNGAVRAEERASKAKPFGAKLTAAALAEKLEALPAIKHRQALMHGDLHAENVRVRNGQAILIDFAAVAQGPLVADPAGLETAICLTAAAPDEKTWCCCLGELYDPLNLGRLPQTRLPGAPMASICDAVRRIRRFGLSEEMSSNEYATALAISLLRHAYRRPLENEDANRRPYLFALAEKIARAIANS
jgi:hypothetical protein